MEMFSERGRNCLFSWGKTLSLKMKMFYLYRSLRKDSFCKVKTDRQQRAGIHFNAGNGKQKHEETGIYLSFSFFLFFFFYLAYCLFWFSSCFFRTFCYVAESKQSFKPPSRLFSAWSCRERHHDGYRKATWHLIFSCNRLFHFPMLLFVRSLQNKLHANQFLCPEALAWRDPFAKSPLSTELDKA